MTVDELIASLSALPPERRRLRVVYWDDYVIRTVTDLECVALTADGYHSDDEAINSVRLFERMGVK